MILSSKFIKIMIHQKSEYINLKNINEINNNMTIFNDLNNILSNNL